MFTYEFKTKDGKTFYAIEKDTDRARCAAKKAAEDEWSPSAKLTRITNKI